MNANTGKKVGFFTDGGGGFYFAKGLLINIAILAMQWWILVYFKDKGSAIPLVFSFILFVGTIGFSIKIWFYTIIAVLLAQSAVDD